MIEEGQARFDGRGLLRVALALLYGGIGAVHLLRPELLLPIMPGWVPEPRLVILVTGLCEVAGALALLGRRLRGPAAIGLALYAVCVYPANLKHALDHVAVPGIPDSWWYHGPRLALQPVLVWAALYAGGLIDWPWRRTHPAGRQETSRQETSRQDTGPSPALPYDDGRRRAQTPLTNSQISAAGTVDRPPTI